MKTDLFILIIILLGTFQIKAQDLTIGLVDINYDLVTDGYTLFSPWNAQTTYLINNCGEQVHKWTLGLPAGLKMSYLDDEGNLWILNENDLYKYDWNGNLKWRFFSQDHGIVAHHDYEIMPNGNFVIIGWEEVLNEEASAIGFDTTETSSQSPIRVDGLYEFKIHNQDSFDLVWKWNFKDHFIQDVDDSLVNFGEVPASPRKLDINYRPMTDLDDFMHCNGLDYNEELDQLLVSARNSSEIYVIDHSTSTEEAASSQGGVEGFGGDFLWRWGKPNLDSQHDPNWIPEDHPNAGMITVFNNFDETQSKSNIKIIDPTVDAQGKYRLDDSNQFLPQEANLVITSSTEEIYSRIMSGTHSLSSGNFIVCSGIDGQFYEITTDGEVVWKYVNPVLSQPIPQFSEISVNFVFNLKKYPIDYIGFQGKGLSSLGIIENVNPLSEACRMVTDVLEKPVIDLLVFPNPSKGQIFFETEEIVEQVQIFAVSGKMLKRINKPSNQINLNLDNGIYLIQFQFVDRTVSKLLTIAN